jgi:hypothetical protein
VERISTLGRSSSQLADPFHPDDGGSTLLRYVGLHKSHTASHPRRQYFHTQYLCCLRRRGGINQRARNNLFIARWSFHPDYGGDTFSRRNIPEYGIIPFHTFACSFTIPSHKFVVTFSWDKSEIKKVIRSSSRSSRFLRHKGGNLATFYGLIASIYVIYLGFVQHNGFLSVVSRMNTILGVDNFIICKKHIHLILYCEYNIYRGTCQL